MFHSLISDVACVRACVENQAWSLVVSTAMKRGNVIPECHRLQKPAHIVSAAFCRQRKCPICPDLPYSGLPELA